MPLPSATARLHNGLAKKNTVEETKFSSELWLNPEIGDLYSRVERITGPFATPLLHQAGLYKISQPIKVLDLCCGTGVLSAHLQQIAERDGAKDKVDIICGDLSESQLARVSKRIQANGWNNVKVALADAMVRTLRQGCLGSKALLIGLGHWST